jgi:hypothetical protein
VNDSPQDKVVISFGILSPSVSLPRLENSSGPNVRQTLPVAKLYCIEPTPATADWPTESRRELSASGKWTRR